MTAPDTGAPGRTAGFVIGIDGGGTASRLVIADLAGAEVVRRTGPPGLVDPRDPAASAAALAARIRDAATDAGAELPAAALCAGLAGTGATAPREAVRRALERSGVAERVEVVQDGEIALDGALAGPGILLAAGTGSVAYGRAEDGRVARCGGWGRFVGDDGSGYAIAMAALAAGLRHADGRGGPTTLLTDLLTAMGLADPQDVPPWVARADKAALAALAPRVIRSADAGDAVATGILDAAATHLAEHVSALIRRLAPWSGPVSLVFHGGLLREPAIVRRLEDRLRSVAAPVSRREPLADAVTGAVRRALTLVASVR